MHRLENITLPASAGHCVPVRRATVDQVGLPGCGAFPITRGHALSEALSRYRDDPMDIAVPGQDIRYSFAARPVRGHEVGRRLSGTLSVALPTGMQGRRCLKATLVGPRSEEHTSELQSRENLVCRLLLEKT